MLTAQRCKVDQKSVRDHLATTVERVERAAETDRVPQRDGGGDERQAACPVLLCVEGAVAEAAETVKVDGAGKRITGLSLVQGRRRLPSEP